MVRLLRNSVLTVLIVLGVAIILLYWRSALEPERWLPAPLPELTGVYAPTELLRNPGYVRFVQQHGPEDIARGPDGHFYTGLNDGRIMRFGPEANDTPQEVTNTGGRVLGLQFDAAGNLIIADAYKGLLKFSADGQLSVLTDAVDGKRMLFVDDLDLAADGTIWFSDASMRFGFDEYAKDFLEASATGRLLSYDPASGTTRVHIRDLFFANGVALGPGDEYVLVNETGTGRIHRLWLRGANSGQRDLFHSGLPGNPDNLSFNGTDTFWVALPNRRSHAAEKTAGYPLFRKLLGGLPGDALPISQPGGFVIGLDASGQVKHCLLGKDDTYHTITSVHQWGGRLYLGSLAMDRVAIVDAPAAAN